MSESVLHLFWTACWQSFVLAVIVYSLVSCLGDRLQPRFQYLLWCVVLLRLALPVPPAAFWGLWNAGSTEQTAVSSVEPVPIPMVPAPVPVSDPVALASAPVPTEPAFETPVEKEASHTIEPSKSDRSRAAVPWKTILPILWLIGGILLLRRHLLDEILLYGRSRNWRPIDEEPWRTLFEECRHAVGVRRKVGFLAVPEEIGAASTGLLRQSVLISEQALRSVSSERLRLILLHELVHIKRWDPLVLRAASILSLIHWPNPTVWFVLSRLQRDRELACDAAVLHILDENRTFVPDRAIRKHYGEAVLAFAERFSVRRRWGSLVGASQGYDRDDGDQNTIARRIDMILKYKRNKISHAVLGTFLVVLLAAFGLTRAAERQKPDNPSGNVSQTVAVPEKTGRGAVAQGRVTDPNGKPVEGALLVWQTEPNDYWDNRSKAVLTDSNGFYRSPELKPIEGSITVIAEGYALEMKKVEFRAGMEPVDFSLKPGKTLEIRFVDPAGKPVPGVRLTMGGNPDPWWRIDSNIYTGYDREVERGRIRDPKIPAYADEKGLYRWTWAPEDKVRFDFSKEGFMSVYTNAYVSEPDNWFVAREEPYKIVMYPEIVVSGTVVDDETGLPVPELRTVPGDIHKDSSPGGIVWQTGRGNEFREGRFEHKFNYFKPEGYRLRIDAPGYASFVSGDISLDSASKQLDVRLKKIAGLSGQVLLPDGSPASGTKIYVVREGQYLQVSNPPDSGLLQGRTDRLTVTADQEGRFNLSLTPEDRFGIYIEHPKGITWVKRDDFLKNPEIHLHAFAKCEILLPDWIKGTKDARIWLNAVDLGRDGFGSIDYQAEIKPDRKNVVFEKVVAGKYGLSISAPSPSHEWIRGSMGRSLIEVLMNVKENETKTFDLNLDGQLVTGKVTLPKSLRNSFNQKDWGYNYIEMTPVDRDVSVCTRLLSYIEQSKDDANTGVFRFGRVPPGKYVAHIDLFKAPVDTTTMDAGFAPSLAYTLIIATFPENGNELDLGTLTRIVPLDEKTVVVFEQGRWKNETTGEFLEAGTVVRKIDRHVYYQYQLEVESDQGKIIPMDGRGEPSLGKRIKLTFDGIVAE